MFSLLLTQDNDLTTQQWQLHNWTEAQHQKWKPYLHTQCG